MSDPVDESLNYLRQYLPKQGPLEFFVHHNTFHELENMPFKGALLKGQDLYEGRVLKSLEDYKSDLLAGKISNAHLEEVIRDFLKDLNLNNPVNTKFCQDLLLSTRIPGTKKIKGRFAVLSSMKTDKNNFFNTILFQEYHLDIDEIISPVLYRYLAAYFDQGVSFWKMPLREEGLLRSFNYYFGSTVFFSAKWEKELSHRIASFENRSAKDVVASCLIELELSEDLWQEYLFDLSLRFKGWGGLILSFEKHPEWNKRDEVVSSFDDFLAILILCEVSYIKSLGSPKQKYLKEQVPITISKPIYSRNCLNSAEGLIANKYKNIDEDSLVQIVTQMTDFSQRFLLHCAYEESFYYNFLSSFEKYQEKTKKPTSVPSLQVLCCIDDREESFRRYIEEQGADIETIGVAGHFGLDIKYKGIFSAHLRALCPDIVTPSKDVCEELVEGRLVRKIFSLWGSFLWMQSMGSKTLIRGLIFQFLTGIFSILSLSLSVISPHYASKMRNRIKAKLDNKLKTRLVYDNSNPKGMSVEEMTRYAQNLLKTIGLVERFAPIVSILGHGSHSLNNPHEAAHDCGACGGGRGAPNARLMAQILNRTDIRKELKRKQIAIPENTIFVGGYHNTCSDEVLFFETTDRGDVAAAIKLIKKSARLDALERCRKYEDVPLEIGVESAFKHCSGRANNYMQPRPEYGHATNALCFVGPRWMSRDLFLDRRAFLTSYEPDQDNDCAEVLRSILSAVGPVCSGINLEYYFSFMDNKVYGCGTKLPHNVTSMVGVMNGYQSDLLLGLPWQMVEIHDPYRLMLLVVCKKETVEKIIEELASFNLLVNNDWIHLSVFDPQSESMYRYKNKQMVKVSYNEAPIKFYKNQKEAFSKKRQACKLGIVRA